MIKRTIGISLVVLALVAAAIPSVGYIRSRIVTRSIIADWQCEKIDHGMSYKWTRLRMKKPDDYLPWVHWLIRYEDATGEGETFVYTIAGGEPH